MIWISPKTIVLMKLALCTLNTVTGPRCGARWWKQMCANWMPLPRGWLVGRLIELCAPADESSHHFSNCHGAPIVVTTSAARAAGRWAMDDELWVMPIIMVFAIQMVFWSAIARCNSKEVRFKGVGMSIEDRSILKGKLLQIILR